MARCLLAPGHQQPSSRVIPVSAYFAVLHTNKSHKWRLPLSWNFIKTTFFIYFIPYTVSNSTGHNTVCSANWSASQQTTHQNNVHSQQKFSKTSQYGLTTKNLSQHHSRDICSLTQMTNDRTKVCHWIANLSKSSLVPISKHLGWDKMATMLQLICKYSVTEICSLGSYWKVNIGSNNGLSPV